jgi:hypothetical protein
VRVCSTYAHQVAWFILGQLPGALVHHTHEAQFIFTASQASNGEPRGVTLDELSGAIRT